LTVQILNLPACKAVRDLNLVLDQSDKSLLRFQQLPISCDRSAKRISAFVQRFA
jgi:hypothetical protein